MKILGIVISIGIIFSNQILCQSPFINTKLLKKGAVELIHKRGEKSKTYRNPNGTFTMVICTNPIHQSDNKGDWIDIISYSSDKSIKTQVDDWIYGDYYCVYYNLDYLTYNWDENLGFRVGVPYLDNYIYRSAIRWDISAIPDNLDLVEESTFFVNMNGSAQEGTIEIYAVDNDPQVYYNQNKANLLYNACGGGISYGSLTITENETGDNIDLSPDFNNKVKQQIDVDWIAMGIKNTSEDTAIIDCFLNFSNGSLYITYTTIPPGGGDDDILITAGPDQISENSQVTYTSLFRDLDVSGSYTEYWDWSISLFHSGGSYVLAAQNDVYGLSECTWTKTVGLKPSGYNWQRDAGGNILGEVKVSTIDSDDWYHEVTKDITFKDPYTPVPYSTSFETGFDQFWRSTSYENGQVKITSSYTPHSGSKHVTMDAKINGTLSLNNMRLQCALSSVSENAKLDFWWKDFGDENHSNDGIYFSDNGGATYVKVYNLYPQSYSNNVWRKFTLDIDELAYTYNLDMSDNFVIKFQQYDDCKISSDGFAFDDISLYVGTYKTMEGIEGEIASTIPEEYELNQNYPNPFNPITTISYALKEEADVELVIYDILGEEVKRLVDGRESVGYKSVVWGGRDNSGNPVASGVYIYRLVAGNFMQVKKMILTR